MQTKWKTLRTSMWFPNRNMTDKTRTHKLAMEDYKRYLNVIRIMVRIKQSFLKQSQFICKFTAVIATFRWLEVKSPVCSSSIFLSLVIHPIEEENRSKHCFTSPISPHCFPTRSFLSIMIYLCSRLTCVTAMHVIKQWK